MCFYLFSSSLCLTLLLLLCNHTQFFSFLVLSSFSDVGVFRSGKVDQAKISSVQLQAQPELAARYRMVDDASGEVKVSTAA